MRPKAQEARERGFTPAPHQTRGVWIPDNFQSLRVCGRRPQRNLGRSPETRAGLALLVALASCSSTPSPPPPASLALTVQAGTDQNPDGAGLPAPVAVRLVFLASPAAFDRGEFFALTEREQATLGADDLGSQEFIVRPGETRRVETAVKPGAQTLGVIVLFRDIDHASWRATSPLKANGPTALRLTIGRLATALAPS